MVKIEDLNRINMLKAVPDHLLEIISQEAQLHIYGADTRLFSTGDELDTYYMMVMGQVALKVALTPDVDVIFNNIQAGGSFGSSTFLKGSTAGYSAVCQEPCEVITLYGPRMIELFETNEELGYHMMTGVAGQYKRAMDERARMILETISQHPELARKIHDIDELTPVY